jgi:hypothetical protein
MTKRIFAVVLIATALFGSTIVAGTGTSATRLTVASLSK